MHKIVLAFDAPHPAPNATDVLLGEQLRANEGGVSLRVDNLVKRTRAADCAGGKVVIAFRPGKALEDEILELGIVGRHIEAEIALGALKAELDGVGLLDNEARGADFEGLGRVVGALVEELGCVGGTLNVLAGQARDDAERQIVEEADAGAHRQEPRALQELIVGSSGGGRKLGGKVEAVPSTVSLSTRAAACKRSVLDSCSSSKM